MVANPLDLEQRPGRLNTDQFLGKAIKKRCARAQAFFPKPPFQSFVDPFRPLASVAPETVMS